MKNNTKLFTANEEGIQPRGGDMSDSPPVMFVFEDAQQPLLPSWVVTCLTINVIMGSGFLGVPQGFVASGLLLGPLVLFGVTVLQWAAACQLAQVASRANALLTATDAAETLTPTLAPLVNSEGGSAARQRPNPPSLILPSHTSYEIMVLCRLYLGRWAERTVMASTVLYMVGTLVRSMVAQYRRAECAARRLAKVVVSYALAVEFHIRLRERYDFNGPSAWLAG